MHLPRAGNAWQDRAMKPMTLDEFAAAVTQYQQIEAGMVYRDERTGWQGIAMPPREMTLGKLPRGVDGRPKCNLLGRSAKDPHRDEIRRAYIDDMIRVDGGAADGFGDRR